MTVDEIIHQSFIFAMNTINEKQLLGLPLEMIENFATGIMANVEIQDATREQIQEALSSGVPDQDIISEVGTQLYDILKEQLGDTALFGGGSNMN
ncbi:MAG: hypothetical protein EOP56_13295 [Sphingobacteriales bacterium]|nr:MAG: hypothetical protein EOP56_13295 [Sphingobacteriales bacterium]